jgi:hypothetical protein
MTAISLGSNSDEGKLRGRMRIERLVVGGGGWGMRDCWMTHGRNVG